MGQPLVIRLNLPNQITNILNFIIFKITKLNLISLLIPIINYTGTILYIINTPEKGEPGFFEATAFTSMACPVGSTILVDQDDIQPYDDYGRLLGKVFCGNQILNEILLRNGHANILTQYCITSEFSGENWAQSYGCDKSELETIPSDCDPSYPDFCIELDHTDLDCSEISERNFTVLPPDPHKFDGDKDGIGCEK